MGLTNYVDLRMQVYIYLHLQETKYDFFCTGSMERTYIPIQIYHRQTKVYDNTNTENVCYLGSKRNASAFIGRDGNILALK